MRARALILAAATAAALALTGCTPAAEDVPVEEEGPLPDATEPQGVPGEDTPSGVGQSPAPGECVQLPVAEDGDYAVGDAGTVTVILEGDELRLDEVDPAEGWTSETGSDGGATVEVTFQGQEEALELVVALDENGLPAPEVCSVEAG